MSFYNLFSYNVKVKYVSCFFSIATFFTLTTTILNLILPFIIAYRGRGFWLRSHSFYEQPVIHFTYEYLLEAEAGDPSKPIACGETNGKYSNVMKNEENCAEFQVQEYDMSGNGKTDLLDFKFNLNLPQDRTLTSITLILSLDFQLKSICPMHMQSLATINKEFSTPPSAFKYFADLQFYQTSHLPCKQNLIHTKYNYSIFNLDKNTHENAIDHILGNYFMRDDYVQTETIAPQSAKERREKKRLAEIRRRGRIKNDTELHNALKMKARERYYKRKAEGNVIPVSEMSRKEKSRERAKAYKKQTLSSKNERARERCFSGKYDRVPRISKFRSRSIMLS